jgi:hypothetical protein
MAMSAHFNNEVRGGYQRSEPFFFESHVAKDFIIGGLIVTNPEGTFRDQGRNTDYYNLQDNASYSMGNHSLRFGAQYQAYRITSLNYAGTTPTYSISTTGNTQTPRLAAALFRRPIVFRRRAILRRRDWRRRFSPAPSTQQIEPARIIFATC